MGAYDQIYRQWQDAPEAFWLEQAKAIDWDVPPRAAFDAAAGVYGRWFPDARGNTCFNCVDRHVEAGRGDQIAIIHESAITNSRATLTFAQLQRETERLAAVLLARDVGAGDRVIIYMPMVMEAAIAMLACARIGAVHSVVFGGFAAAELATRIDDCAPKIILSASCGLEPGRVVAYKPLLDRALELADHTVASTLILQREQQRCDLVEGRDEDWGAAVAEHKDARVACIAVAATDPLYILYTSGTTGQPKGVVRDSGGHMVALHWSMANIYGVQPGETFWAASDVGWVVGHSYIVYGPLLAGNTTILFEGKPVGTPDAATFWRVMAEHKVTAFFTAPTAFRAVRAQDPEGKLARQFDLSHLRAIFLAGERADPDTIHWIERVAGKPVIDHWWQTETGWTIAGNPVGIEQLPVKYGSPARPMPGYAVEVLDDAGAPVPTGTLGNVAIKLPLPPSALPTLWNADARFRSAYLDEFPGYYQTSDAGMMDEDGYLFIMARTDDIINVAGHRLATGAMEEAVAEHTDVAECAVIGVADEMKGQVPVGFIILNAGARAKDETIKSQIVAHVRERIGPVAAFKTVVPVKRLPKTRSGKILRATMVKVVEGQDVAIPATIDDPAILDEIKTAWSAQKG